MKVEPRSELSTITSTLCCRPMCSRYACQWNTQKPHDADDQRDPEDDVAEADAVEHEHEQLLERRVVVQEDQHDDVQDEADQGPEPLPSRHVDLRMPCTAARHGVNPTLRVRAAASSRGAADAPGGRVLTVSL